MNDKNDPNIPDNDTPDDDEWISKTRRKQDMHYRQQLGEKLLTLKPAEWDELPLDERLHEALIESTRITKNEALRRHKQFIGKLMKDQDVTPLELFFEQRETAHQLNTRAFRDLETLRDQLIAGDNSDIGETIARFPGIDTQKLRQLVRNAKKSVSQGGQDKSHSRALFRFLRDQNEG